MSGRCFEKSENKYTAAQTTWLIPPSYIHLSTSIHKHTHCLSQRLLMFNVCQFGCSLVVTTLVCWVSDPCHRHSFPPVNTALWPQTASSGWALGLWMQSGDGPENVLHSLHSLASHQYKSRDSPEAKCSTSIWGNPMVLGHFYICEQNLRLFSASSKLTQWYIGFLLCCYDFFNWSKTKIC